MARWSGKQIAAKVGVSPATASHILKRLGLDCISAWSRLSRCGVLILAES